ncbi:hypothetical protein [Peribacillus simplex]|uniref:Uncharacterized protein n=1 Tax=Peribacillus simplex TaxID=1478 RepID=A0A9W4KRX6_9BACI|nr:hypothetical protein [Peribacillus simplex]MDR4928215.1 hypothetical protein [Peribacillus simplex]WHX91959.1 hypothetical protein QNH50_03415 [Peribacillus simplex]CAH0135228.1 hypothetical protein SRABI133_00336 [Peribacillus simplex]
MTAVLIRLQAVLHAVLVRLELLKRFSLYAQAYKLDMIMRYENSDQFLYKQIWKIRKKILGLTENRAKPIRKLGKYRNVLSPFLINDLQTNIDQWEMEIHDWEEELKKSEKEKESF